jgi:hypothetical protein
MPTLRDHLAAHDDAGKGGGHHHGGHHHHHGGRRGGGIVFYDRDPDVVVVERDCPPGFYYDDFGNCRPLPYHSMNAGRFPAHGFPAHGLADDVGALGDPPEDAFGPKKGGYDHTIHAQAAYVDAGQTHTELSHVRFFDAGQTHTELRRVGAFDAGQTPVESSAVPVGWFNPFDPYGSGYALETNVQRNALDSEIQETDARVVAAQKGGAKIPNDVIFDYVSFRKDWDAVNNDKISTVQLNSMRARFRAELDALAKYMKVEDLRPPAPAGKQLESALDSFTDSTREAVGVAQIGVVGMIALAAVVLYVAAPELGLAVRGSLKQSAENAALARKLAK